MARKSKATENRTMLNKAVQGMAALDSFQNVLARTGVGMPNIMEGTAYPLTRLTKDYNTMNSLYRNSWLARRIIDIIPKDMLKNWVKYTSDISPEQIDAIHKMERTTRLKASLLRGLNWGRLYGGAAGLIMLEGQEEILDEPLDLDSVMPGDFKGLLIVDRWSGVYPQLQLVDNISSPEFGLPEIYRFQDQAKKENYEVHHSRIIRFVGDDLPEWEKQAESYWGASKIEAVFEELKKRDNTSANIANIIFQANLKIIKMADLGELLIGSNEKTQQDLYQTIQAQSWLMNNFGMYIMSKEDDFQNINSKFEGLNDIYESFMMDVSGAAQIPVTRLFGRSPAGLNATGESDSQNYYGVVEDDQEAHLRPVLEKLLPIMCLSVLGDIPDDMDFVFNPVHTVSDKDKGESVKWKTDAIYGAHDRGLISDQTGMKELKELQEEYGVFTNITDEDIEAASNEIVKPEPAMPGEEGDEDNASGSDTNPSPKRDADPDSKNG